MRNRPLSFNEWFELYEEILEKDHNAEELDFPSFCEKSYNEYIENFKNSLSESAL